MESRGGAGVWSFPVVNNADVSTQKPIRLAKAFVSDFTNPGELICDPFMGSGTTGKMAKLNNRRFIGIEKVEEYFNIAKERIETATAQVSLFD